MTTQGTTKIQSPTARPDTADPARRPDVLFRVRRDEGEEISSWWMVGAFVFVSGAVFTLLSFVPGGV